MRLMSEFKCLISTESPGTPAICIWLPVSYKQIQSDLTEVHKFQSNAYRHGPVKRMGVTAQWSKGTQSIFNEPSRGSLEVNIAKSNSGTQYSQSVRHTAV